MLTPRLHHSSYNQSLCFEIFFGFFSRRSVWSPRTVCLDFKKALSSFHVNVHHNGCLADNY